MTKGIQVSEKAYATILKAQAKIQEKENRSASMAEALDKIIEDCNEKSRRNNG